MRRDFLPWRLALTGALVCLLLSEVAPELHRAIYGSFDSSYSLRDRILDTLGTCFLLFAVPLLIVMVGVLYSSRLGLVTFLALTSLAIGAFVSFALFTSDPSGGVLKILSVLTYWVAAFLSLFALGLGSQTPVREPGDTSSEA
jgi:predicted membrane protein